MTNTAHGTGDVSESTPLLQETPIHNNITTNANTIDGSDHLVSEATHHVAHRRKWRVKFSLSYGRGNVLLSLFQGAQGLFALVLLPFITRIIAVPRGWSPWTRDRRYAVVSIAATTSGLLVIALAPVLWIEIVGLLLISLGSCTNGLLMSLMGGAVRPDQVSAMYSAALMLSIIFRSGTGPIVSALFVAGLELGWKWLGLPFAVMAALIACEFGASLFIRAEKDKNVEHDE
ncbi:hypothetical protein F4825DRAFT_434846 [Nemania diffusa]|nr:hypothetical protein F4825DRAFT_434846 [Nemania diffusa]